MKEFQFPIGQKVKGYGLLNEYGEFDFIPEQKGVNQGQVTIVKQTPDFTISKSKKFVILHAKLQRQSRIELIKSYIKLMNSIMLELNNYEF